jgi:hypothetical protein
MQDFAARYAARFLIYHNGRGTFTAGLVCRIVYLFTFTLYGATVLGKFWSKFPLGPFALAITVEFTRGTGCHSVEVEVVALLTNLA